MPPTKPILDRVYYNDDDRHVLSFWLNKFKEYNFLTGSPEEETLRSALNGQAYFDAGSLPEIIVRPPKDNAVFKANQMIPNRELRNLFYNTIDYGLTDPDNAKDSRTYVNRLYDLYLKSNKPTIKSTTSRFSPGMLIMQGLGIMRGDENRPSYDPFLNTMYISPKDAASDIIAEMSHAYLIHGTDTPRNFNWMKLFLSRPNGDIKINGVDGYNTPGSAEFVAHKIIEPRFHMYVNSGRFPYDFIWNSILKAYNKPRKRKLKKINTEIQ